MPMYATVRELTMPSRVSFPQAQPESLLLDSIVPVSLLKLIYVKCISTLQNGSTYPVLRGLTTLILITRIIPAFIVLGLSAKGEEPREALVIVFLSFQHVGIIPRLAVHLWRVNRLESSIVSTYGVPRRGLANAHQGQRFEYMAVFEETPSYETLLFVELMFPIHIPNGAAIS